jgi:hypothetical protein
VVNDNISTMWLSITAGCLAVAFALVVNGVTGVLQVVLMAVLGIAELVCFALLVAKAAARPRG